MDKKQGKVHIYVNVLQLHRSGREIRLWHAGLSMDDWGAALPREQGYERRDTPAPNDQDMLVVRASRPSEGEAKRQKTTSDSGTASSQQRRSIARQCPLRGPAEPTVIGVLSEAIQEQQRAPGRRVGLDEQLQDTKLVGMED